MNGQPTAAPAAGWTPLQRRLHWLVAAALAAQYLLAIPMHDAAVALAAVERGSAAPALGDWLVTTLHATNGVVLALLVLWRLNLRRRHRAEAPRRATLARASHALLYGLVLLMACSGALHWYAGIEGAATWHAIGKWTLLGAVALHVAAALRHASRRDGVFGGMLPQRRTQRPS